MERADVLDVQARTSRHSARARSWNPEGDSESLSNEEASNAQAGCDARIELGAIPHDRLVVHVEDSRSRVASKPGNLASARTRVGPWGSAVVHLARLWQMSPV